jgi:hypothetical protein
MGNNPCSIIDPENLVNDYAAATYQFCSSIQAAQSVITDTCFTSDKPNDPKHGIHGNAAILKAFIADQVLLNDLLQGV